MSAITEVILNSQIIKDIEDNPEKLKMYLQKEPPEEWIMEGISELTGEKYKYLSIEVLEFLMDTIFNLWEDKVLSSDFVFTNGSATVTVSVSIPYNSFVSKSGIASITVMDNFYYDKVGVMKFRDSKIKRPVRASELLRTATPLCFTEAKKNAIKNICNLFGRNLNRETLENVPRGTSEFQKEVADIIIIRKYENAVLNNDEKTIKEILNNYELPNA